VVVQGKHYDEDSNNTETGYSGAVGGAITYVDGEIYRGDVSVSFTSFCRRRAAGAVIISATRGRAQGTETMFGGSIVDANQVEPQHYGPTYGTRWWWSSSSALSWSWSWLLLLWWWWWWWLWWLSLCPHPLCVVCGV
jgi:hypothetical protein